MSNREYDNDNRGYLNPESQHDNRYSTMRNDDRYYRGSRYDERYVNPGREIRDYNDYETPRMNDGDRGWRGNDIYQRYDSPRSLDPYRNAWNDWTGNDKGSYYRSNTPDTGELTRDRPFDTDYWGNRYNEGYNTYYSRTRRRSQNEVHRGYGRNYEEDRLRDESNNEPYGRNDHSWR